MAEKRPISPRDSFLGTARVFLMAAVLLMIVAVYKYNQYSEFDAQPGLKIMSDWSVFIRLYEWGGTRAVVGFILSLVGVCLVASFLLWRTGRTLPGDPPAA
jgi:hypothetical protein